MVTGGAGFIGSHLVDGLIDGGYRVRALDNLTPPTHNGNLPEWFNKKAEFIKGDVREKSDWTKALAGVDYVFHLAAYMDYHLDFSTYFDANTRSTALLYEVIAEEKLPVQKIILTSSQSVYGEGKYRCPAHGIVYPDPRPVAQLERRQWEMVCSACGKFLEPLPQKEDDELKPQIPYGVSKWALEKAGFNLGKLLGIPTVTARYSIVHGPRQSFRHFYSGALRSFAVQALAGQPINIHEDGLQLRDFVNVKDVTAAHIKLLEDSRADSEAFNIGSGEPTRVVDLAKAVCAAAGAPFQPQTGEFRVGAPRHSVMDVSKLKELGWAPKFTIQDNAKEYVGWVKQYPEAKEYLEATLADLKNKKIIR